MALKINQKAPDFSLLNQDNKVRTLKSFKGKWLVLYFYPKDNTSGCTIEAIDFTKNLNDFKKLNASIVGISADSIKKHCDFISKQKLKINLLSDEKKEVIKKYGIWGEKKFISRTYEGIIKSTFLIDKKGTIAHIWPNVKVKDHVNEVKAKLEELS